MRNDLSAPAAPAMTVFRKAENKSAGGAKLTGILADSKKENQKGTVHQENLAPAGYVSEELWALVHTPIAIDKALQIPAAREAWEKEWKKLEGRKAWLLNSVREYDEVESEARKENRSVHFGQVMQLCHEKHSELQKAVREFKGRIVFRGDIVKDESGCFAVFSEQGTSASHLSAAKFLDAIARMPGCSGEDSDAVGAYTQVLLEEADRLLGPDVFPETWITLPRNRWTDKMLSLIHI